MWNRACPLCFTKVPRSLLLTRGDELTCPSCGTPLELSRTTRVLGAACGFVAAFVAAQAVWDLSLKGRWALLVVAAILGYGIASAMVLCFLADLVVQPRPPHMGAH
ncbi:MAG: hypothetical protein WAK48_03225 [Candidatus Acidiferrum sp.]|jgi:hypothetical protein